jgi:hypothetical protein
MNELLETLATEPIPALTHQDEIAEQDHSDDYVEECKRMAEKGSGNAGDFTYAELREKAREFRGEQS